MYVPTSRGVWDFSDGIVIKSEQIYRRFSLNMSLQIQKQTWASVAPNKESKYLLHSCPNLQWPTLGFCSGRLRVNYTDGWKFTPGNGDFLMGNQLTS